MNKFNTYYENVSLEKLFNMNDLKEIGSDGSSEKRIFKWGTYRLEMFEEIFTEYVVYNDNKEIFRYMDIYNNFSIDSITTTVYLDGKNNIIIKNNYIEFLEDPYETILTFNL